MFQFLHQYKHTISNNYNQYNMHYFQFQRNPFNTNRNTNARNVQNGRVDGITSLREK